MKNFLLAIFLSIFILCLKANALNFEEGFIQSDRKPLAVLVYAQWADNYQCYLQTFRSIQPKFEDTYNFVEMDIANKDTRYFNQRFHIYPNLPYILMYRNGGKVSRYIPNNCASDASCIITKLQTFNQ